MSFTHRIPGFTDEVSIQYQKNLRIVNRDFACGYSPERK